MIVGHPASKSLIIHLLSVIFIVPVVSLVSLVSCFLYLVVFQPFFAPFSEGLATELILNSLRVVLEQQNYFSQHLTFAVFFSTLSAKNSLIHLVRRRFVNQ